MIINNNRELISTKEHTGRHFERNMVKSACTGYENKNANLRIHTICSYWYARVCTKKIQVTSGMFHTENMWPDTINAMNDEKVLWNTDKNTMA